jgi:hypothetical protein
VTDPLLRRVERTAVAACLLMAGVGWLMGGWWIAVAVLGGGLISAVSYAGLASGVTALTAAAGRAAALEGGTGAPVSTQAVPDGDGVEAHPASKRPRAGAKALAGVVLRYALLGLLAYVMIARLRLHPVGLLAGVSSVVIAVGVEALRILVKKS